MMSLGIKDILLITTSYEQNLFVKLLGNGSKWGININYKVQPKPEGIAQSFLIASDFIADDPCALILGDNIFYGPSFNKKNFENVSNEGATVFAYRVSDPERYGVVETDSTNKVISIEEKPTIPKSNFVITGLYFYDCSVLEKAKQLKFSNRGELEITDLNNLYLREKNLNVKFIDSGSTWLDTGTVDSLYDACSLIKTVETRQGIKLVVLKK